MNVDLVLVIVDYVYQIAKLPQRPPIIPDGDAEITVWNTQRNFYRGLSLWLKNKLLGQALSPEAYEPLTVWVQPYADYYAALFRLVVEVHSRTSNPDLLNFSSPAALWFQCVSATAKNTLKDSGLTDLPRVVGKAEAYKANIEICRKLEKLCLESEDVLTMEYDAEFLLIIEAQAIAKDKDNWNFHYDYFLPFIRVARRAFKTARQCSHLQSHYVLPGGKLFITKEKRKLPPKV